MLPATGVRMTCTSSTFRKIETRVLGSEPRPSSPGGVTVPTLMMVPARRSEYKAIPSGHHSFRIAEEKDDRGRQGN